MNSNQNDEQPGDTAPADPSPTGHSEATPPHTPPQSSPSDSWLSISHPSTHNRTNLQQASVALDAAYERITQLRNSINSLLHRMPPDSINTTPRSPRPGNSVAAFAPGHSALVLTDGEMVEELNFRSERLRTLISPTVRQRLEDFERTRSTNRRDYFQWERFLQGERPRYLGDDVPTMQTMTVSPLRSRSPPMPDLVVPRTRTSTDSRVPIRRDLYNGDRDDSSTMIGRRVAARVAAGLQDSSVSQLSALEQRLQAHTAQIAHELQSMTERLETRRAEQLAATGTPVNASSGTPRDGSLPEGVIFPPIGRGRTAVESSYERPQPRTGESFFDNSTPSPPLLPMRNSLANNSSGTEGLPFNQTGPSAQDIPVTLSAFLDLGNPAEVRDRLRELLARDRQELPPSTHSAADVVRRGNTIGRGDRPLPSQPQVSQTRRRRGWARLNADGDEITSDDDGSPHTRRLRMRLSHVIRPTPAQQLAARLGVIDDTQWRASAGQENDNDPGVVLLGSDTDDDPPSHTYQPYPLPTFVEDMLEYPKSYHKRSYQNIPVSKTACVYGR
ncbi:hypothetical protein V8B97DRAFT_901379 [Scleroderma yunnanense]